jgi:hypothetical protein
MTTAEETRASMQPVQSESDASAGPRLLGPSWARRGRRPAGASSLRSRAGRDPRSPRERAYEALRVAVLPGEGMWRPSNVSGDNQRQSARSEDAMVNWEIELFKAGLTVATSVIGAALAWFVGSRISSFWTVRQRRKEIYLATRGDFFRLYGEFFAIWKGWNHYLGHKGTEAHFPDDLRWRILDRACTAEGGVEAILVRLSTELNLDDKDVEHLGRFRQAYRRLRENIRANRALPWASSDHEEYVTFKALACHLISLLDRLEDKLPTTATAKDALLRITSNDWEGRWVEVSSVSARPM